MASVFLNGIVLANFRGIGKKPQFIAPFREINFLIGPNNSGKSTVLQFLARYLIGNPAQRSERWQRSFEPLDVHIGSGTAPLFGVAVSRDDIQQKLTEGLAPRLQLAVSKIFDYVADGDLVFLYPDGPRLLKFKESDIQKFKSVIEYQDWHDLWTQNTHQSGGDISQHWIPEVLTKFANALDLNYPDVKFVPAIREISAAGIDFTDYSGRGLIDKLAEYQNPPHDERDKRAKFEAINDFLRAVTESDDATIEVPHDRKHLLVHMDGKVLPLTSLGTGIHEVIMLASFCTLVEREIVCIEEPEIHLHPLLQRKFIRYLRDKTSNQYFIATHAPSLIDSVRASIFSVDLGVGGTEIRLAAAPAERYEICRQLGYLASDLLQSNAIIWVEGPSDRIYLNHWIRAVAPELVEGIDYSIMFYGGRLLSHLSAEDHEVEEFIALRRLNRNIAILIDSDKQFPQSKINSTKQRVVDEFSSAAWVTSGREIENYVPPSLVVAALQQLHGKTFDRLSDDGRYAHRLKFITDDREASQKEGDKVKVAKLVCAQQADLSELDLKVQIERLVAFIRKANHSR